MIEVLGLITARGGSKGLPRKNVRLVGGKPLIAWSILAARQNPRINRLIVSTDDPEIAQVGHEWGAEAPFIRPASLSQDTSPHIDVVEHTLKWLAEYQGYEPDYILLLQPTSPFRTPADIDAAIQLAEGRAATAVVSVTPLQHHPFLARSIDGDGKLLSFIDSSLKYPRRQDLPPAYAINGAIYLNRCDSLMKEHTFLPTDTYAYIMPPERSLDIDSEWDLHLANLILTDRAKHEND